MLISALCNHYLMGPIQDRAPPIEAQLVGVDRGHYIEVVFKNPTMWTMLGHDSMKQGNYEHWDWLMQDWLRYPRPHEKLYVFRGQVLLFRKHGVSACDNLAFYTSMSLPAVMQSKLLDVVKTFDVKNMLVTTSSSLLSPRKNKRVRCDSDSSGDESIPWDAKGKGKAVDIKRRRTSSPPPDVEVLELSSDDGDSSVDEECSFPY